MADSNINKELKQELAYCEEESEKEGQKEAQDSREAQSQTPEKSEVQDSEAKFTPPRTPLSNVEELHTLQERDKVSPDQVLKTPVSDSLKCPETPAQPDSRSKVPHCESPFTPKVSKLSGKRDQVAKICVPSVQLIKRTQSFMCIW